MSGLDVAEYTLAAIREGKLFVLPHPEFESGIQERMEKILAHV